MKFNYKIKTDDQIKDFNNPQYIELTFYYKEHSININIYNAHVIIKGIDEQKLFNFYHYLDFHRLNDNDIKFKTNKNSIKFYLKNTKNNQFEIILDIKQVNNKLFFKNYFKSNLNKRAFCYINKENKTIYNNPSQIIFKHLIQHQNKGDCILKIISDKIISFNNKSSEDKFYFEICNKNIIKMTHSTQEDNVIRYLNTEDSIYYINNLKLFHFLFGVQDLSKQEIYEMKLSEKLSYF